MPPLMLTPEKAFRVIQEMNHRGKRVSGRAVWQQCGEIGSITTAVKWVKVATAITQSSEPVDQDLVDLWEAIAQGKDVPASASVVHELPQALRELFDRFSQQVAIALQQSVAAETRQTQQTAVSEIEQAEADTIKAQKQSQQLTQTLQQQEAIAQEQGQTIAELNEQIAALNARGHELEQQVQRVEEQRMAQELLVRERSQQLGTLTEKNTRLNQDVQHLQQQNKDIRQTMSDLQENLVEHQEREQAIASKFHMLEKDHAVLETQLQTSQKQLEREQQEHDVAKARLIELTQALTAKASEAAAASERVAQYEARIMELQEQRKSHKD